MAQRDWLNSPTYVSSSGTTVVSSAGNQGVLAAVMVTNSGVPDIVLQDSGGNVKATLDGTLVEQYDFHDMAFPDGLEVVVSSHATPPSFTVLSR